jgi:hypothetical protein
MATFVTPDEHEVPATPTPAPAVRPVRRRMLSATRRLALAILGTIALLAVAGSFFYFMVKAMARIQMPTRLPKD